MLPLGPLQCGERGAPGSWGLGPGDALSPSLMRVWISVLGVGRKEKQPGEEPSREEQLPGRAVGAGRVGACRPSGQDLLGMGEGAPTDPAVREFLR